jgi:hypothetical protein
MPDNHKPSKPKAGTGRAYLLMRLEQGGHRELLAAVQNQMLSVYAAAIEAGIIKRPPSSGGGSGNARRRRNAAVFKAFRAFG